MKTTVELTPRHPNWILSPDPILSYPYGKALKDMRRYWLVFGFLIVAALISDRAAGQVIVPPVLVGVGKGRKQMEELNHLYAIDAKIVLTAAKIGTPTLARAFVSATAHTDCCDPAVQVATSCWLCCDSTVICTDNASYSSVVAESAKVSDAEWKLIQTKGLDSIEGWPEVNKLLEISPTIEVSKEDPKFGEFLKKMDQRFQKFQK